VTCLNDIQPERWLETNGKTNEMDATSLVFGIGARVCLGTDINIKEIYKLLPEVSAS
jgi:cytochrome P450